MVDIEVLDDTDRERLRTLVERHGALTGSSTAQRILASWSVEVSRFRKVMPTDYRRVLDVMAAAEAEGLDEERTLARVMEASHG
jgi:glutamate synthase (NADPH/NADH) large chain